MAVDLTTIPCEANTVSRPLAIFFFAKFVPVIRTLCMLGLRAGLKF